MARSYQDVQALKASQTEVEVQGLPPGYMAGGDLTLTVNGGAYAVEIDPFICNVRGKQVSHDSTYTIVDGDFMNDRVSGCWYYVYVDDAGLFHVDSLAPNYDTDYHAYYHPVESSYRNLGKLYISDDNDYVFCTPKIEGRNESVLVAASTYKGDDAQYYCTGTDDQYLINAAILFLKDAYGSGKVNVSTGTFSTTAVISMYSSIHFSMDTGTIIERNCDDYVISGVGASGSEYTGIKVTGGKLTAADANSKVLVYFTYCDDGEIRNVFMDSGPSHGISIDSCDRFRITECICNGNAGIGISAVHGTFLILDNNICNGSSGGEGISVNSMEYCRIFDNICYGNTGIGIELQNTEDASATFFEVRGNRCYNNTSRGLSIKADCTNYLVLGNYCNANGSDTGIANTNGHNFVDAGSNTIIFGNSWQELGVFPGIVSATTFISATHTPASAGAAGIAGTITWDGDYLYVCTATDTWERVGIASW